MEKGWQEVYMTASEYKAEMAKDILENAVEAWCVFPCRYEAEKDKARSVELLKNLKGE